MLKQDLVRYMSDVSPHLEHHRVLERQRVLKEPPDERTGTITRFP
jgi:hypothetical protein